MPDGHQFAPRRLLSEPPDHYSPVRLLAFPAWSRRLIAAFCSLTTTARFRTPIARSKLPTCCFNASTGHCTGPFDRWLFRPARFAPSPVGITVTDPFPVSRPAAFGSFPDPHSPSGLLPPSGSKRSIRFVTEKLVFRIRPIAFRSPQPLYKIVPAADHRSRLATFPESRCSSNLLEPSPSCIRLRNSSNIFLSRDKVFHNKHLLKNVWVTASAGCVSCG